jgi:hypothetical protein
LPKDATFYNQFNMRNQKFIKRKEDIGDRLKQTLGADYGANKNKAETQTVGAERCNYPWLDKILCLNSRTMEVQGRKL